MPSSGGTSGVQWNKTGGKISTTASGKAVWIAAARAAGPDGAALAERIQAEKDWRHKYTQYCVDLTRLQCTSTEACLAVSRAGIAAAYEQFHFAKADGETTLTDAVKAGGGAPLATAMVSGSGGEPAIEVPLGGRAYSGAEAAELVAGWARYGSAESSVADSVTYVCSKDAAWLKDVFANRVFVLLGATSAAGPALPLLRMGATVAAVARKGAKMAALVEAARGTPGTLLVPCTGDVPNDPTEVGKTAGADVLEHMPEIVAWLRQLEPGKQLVIGSYIYLDGELHVRATMAMDSICSSLLAARSGTALAQLCSPGTAHAITTEAHALSQHRFENPGFGGYINPLFWTSFERNATPPAKGTAPDGKEIWLPVIDGLSVLQGPNYALAKHLQHWRAMVARADGAVVSANMAPPMYTESMVHVDTLRVALNGMQAFTPLAAYQPDTASAVLTMMLLRDVTDSASKANPGAHLDNPIQLFIDNAWHGGCWSCAYKQQSIGKALYLAGKLYYRSPPEAPPRA
eukprot:TRINITY_DN3135_c0_g1_i2.p1 TRINITY_DN3135_c0_g1~~TRINITY_DN3135_c0_g1_i2.p1  ORF type:complete len:517 (+),score=125.57 TRINITY_DN3135_c0_g1_i2:90-1640(+)